MNLTINEPNLIKVAKIKNERTGAYINSGIGTYLLKAQADDVLSSGSVTPTGSGGTWYGVIPKVDAAALVARTVYRLEVSVSDGAGAEGFRVVELPAYYHGAEP